MDPNPALPNAEASAAPTRPTRFAFLAAMPGLFIGLAGAYGVRLFVEMFLEMASSGLAGNTAVAMGFIAVNRPLLGAFIAAFLTLVGALLWHTFRPFSPPSRSSLVILAALLVTTCLPALMLWWAENVNFQMSSDSGSSGLGVGIEKINLAVAVSTLLGLISPLLVGGAVLAVLILDRKGKRPLVRTSTVTIFLFLGALGAGLAAVALYLRNAALEHAARIGNFLEL